MAVTPGTTSGTFDFGLTNGGLVTEAFDRIGLRPPQLDRHHFISAQTSINLVLIDWENIGVSLWKVVSGVINLVAGQATYTMPSNLVVVTEVFYTQVNANGAGVNNDRIMTATTRTAYAMLPNKLQQGVPTQYWYQMTSPPQLTLWQVPQVGQVAPAYVVSWYGLQQFEDATTTSGQTPNVIRRGLEALCSELAFRLCEKFGPSNPQARQALMTEKRGLADAAWGRFARRDQEQGPVIIQPNIAAYGNLR